MPKSVQRCVTKRSSSTNDARVEEEVDALARGELARLVLLLDALWPPPSSAGVQLVELGD